MKLTSEDQHHPLLDVAKISDAMPGMPLFQVGNEVY